MRLPNPFPLKRNILLLIKLGSPPDPSVPRVIEDEYALRICIAEQGRWEVLHRLYSRFREKIDFA
jgi:hypothetical protein